MGDIVEFSAKFHPSPIHKIKKILEIMPIYSKIENRKKLIELDVQIAIAEKMKPNEIFDDGVNQIKLNSHQLLAMKASLKSQRDQLLSDYDESTIYAELISKTLESGVAEIIVGKNIAGNYICKAYRKFAREGVFDDIYNAEWRVMGKIIGIIYNSEEYDTLKGSAFDMVPSGDAENIISGFDPATININFAETKINGPALVIAPLGIFS